VGVALAVIWADRRFKLGHGRAFALYVLLYTLGRGWIESLRIDSANEILGLRLNVWTSIVVGLGALTYLVVSNRMRPGREVIAAPTEPVEEKRYSSPIGPTSSRTVLKCCSHSDPIRVFCDV